VVYRLGGLEISAIEDVVGPVIVKDHSSSNPAAPGQLDSHYAPRKPFILGDLKVLIQENLEKGTKFGVLSFSDFFSDLDPAYQITMSSHRDLHEAAKNLFSAMRKLDETPVEVILAELTPETGLGRAINDRLRRAAVKG
jgi:L-threonylcarbamoyladenylate synthase